jgi:hypothetical protein
MYDKLTLQDVCCKTFVELLQLEHYLALNDMDSEKHGIGTPHCDDSEKKLNCPSVQV